MNIVDTGVHGERHTASLAKIRRFDRVFFGHPLGVLILSMNEVWERFSYYGMRAILILYLVDQVKHGGMGFSYAKAGAIYGLYTSLIYTMILPGGWIADTFLGQRRSLLIGGIIILLGHISLAFVHENFFYLGLGLIILGTALLKPCSSVMVSSFYPKNDPRQDSGYTIYYMCINIGSLLGPLVCGYLGQKVSWHLGFGAAAVGMFFGIIVYVLGYPTMGDVGHLVADEQHRREHRGNVGKLFGGTGAVIATLGLLFMLNHTGTVHITFVHLQFLLGIFLIILPIVYFGMLFLNGQWTKTEKNHLIVLGLFYVFSIFFWAASEQQGSLLNIFADQLTRCTIFGWEFPSSWFQSVNPAFIIILTPFFAWLWPALGKRDPSTPAKFTISMALTTVAFAIMIGAAIASGPQHQKVGASWLTWNLFVLTAAEMCLSPVGLAAFARLAPARIASQMMGIWFLNDSLASLMAGAAGGAYEHIPLTVNFMTTTIGVAVVTVLLFLTTPFIRRLMGSVK